SQRGAHPARPHARATHGRSERPDSLLTERAMTRNTSSAPWRAILALGLAIPLGLSISSCDLGTPTTLCASGLRCPEGTQCTAAGDACTAGSCGNAALDPGEVCDDGNLQAGDGCSSDCLSDETCGNGLLDGAAGEACDDGNTVPGDGCSPDCRLEYCGNGYVEEARGEVCDDGNTEPGDGCSADCK